MIGGLGQVGLCLGVTGFLRKPWAGTKCPPLVLHSRDPWTHALSRLWDPGPVMAHTLPILAQGGIPLSQASMRLKFVLLCARALAAFLSLMSASLVARFWDSLREGGITSYELLACTEDKTIHKLVGADLMPTARLEKELAQEVLDFKIHNIQKEGLPSPPPPSRVMPSKAPLSALTAARKPFQLPKHSPAVAPRATSSQNVVVNQVEKKRKVVERNDQVLESLWKFFLALGKFGNLWADSLNKVAFQNEAKSVLSEDWSKCKQLQQHVAALQAWTDYCDKVSEDWRTPNSISVRAFLATFRGDGAYTPKRYFDSMRWLQTNIGINATTELYRVRRSVDAPGSHVPVQATPLKPSVISMISNAILSDNIFIAALACFWDLLVSAVVRPRHLQRSSLDLSGRHIIGHSTAGKIRTLGLQRPFKWACPARDMANADLLLALRRVTEATGCSNIENSFIMPDFHPQRSDWASARSFTNTPMELPKILRLMGLYLRSQGLPIEELDQITGLYSGRRVQPTVADYCQKPVEFRLDIGDWSDKSSRDRVAMPNLYSAARLHTQVSRKREMLSTANLAFATYLTEDGSQPHPSWDDLFFHFPNQNTIDEAMKAASLESTKVPIPVKDKSYHGFDSDNEFWDDLMAETSLASNAEDAHTSASEDSDEDQDAAAEDEIFPAETAKLNWQLSSGKHGRLHLLDGLCLHCSRVLRRPEEGRGLSQALATGRLWSPRCWAALSPAAQQWWASADQTDA